MQFTIRSFVMIVLLIIIAMLLVLLSSMINIHSASQAVAARDWDVIAYTINKALSSNMQHSLDESLPMLMSASNVNQIEIRDANHILAHFQIPLEVSKWENWIAARRVVLTLSQSPDYTLVIIYIDPVLQALFSIRSLAMAGIAIIGTLFLVWFSLYWLYPRVRGIKQLEKRANLILTSARQDISIDNQNEWPLATSQALDLLLCEHQKHSKERTHVDMLIRTFFAQDAFTGVRSRLSFEHQLAIQLEEPNAYGVVMMIRLPDFELDNQFPQHGTTDVLQEALINILSSFSARHPSALLARYFNNDFIVLLPHSAAKEASNMAIQLLNSVNTLPLTGDLRDTSLMSIGITTYCGGQVVENIISYANQALRNAELQGNNSCFVYDNNIPRVKLGSVRWRTLLNQVLDHGRGLHFYEKPVITIDGQLDHREITCRLYDGKQELLYAEYIPWLHQLKLTQQYDKRVINSMLPLLTRWPNQSIAFTVTVESLLDVTFFEWLVIQLREQGITCCQRIMFELTEADTARYLEQLIPIVRTLSQLGCRIAVIQAGLSIVSTAYIQQLSIDVIKLYSGLVRHIKMHPENQLIVEILCGACTDANVKLFATGVRTQNEWAVLCDKGLQGGQGDLFAAWKRLLL